jgi:predicted nucleic acid-binding protein
MYLLGSGGWHDQEALWRLVGREDLVLSELTRPQIERARTLMEKYRNVPMDLADATLVALAEVRALTRIFTLDDDFRVYRLAGRRALDVVP